MLCRGHVVVVVIGMWLACTLIVIESGPACAALVMFTSSLHLYKGAIVHADS